MTDDATVTRESIDADIDAVASVIARAHLDIAANRTVDLAPMETSIKTVCDHIRLLPPDQIEGLLTKVTHLVQSLDQLAQDLTAQNKARLDAFSQGDKPQG